MEPKFKHIYDKNNDLDPGLYIGNVHLPKDESLENGLEVESVAAGLLKNDDNRFLWTEQTSSASPMVLVFKNGDILLSVIVGVGLQQEAINFVHCKEMISSIAEIHLYARPSTTDKITLMTHAYTLLFDKLNCEETPQLLVHSIPSFSALVIRRAASHGIVHIAANVYGAGQEDADNALTLSGSTTARIVPDVKKARQALRSGENRFRMFNETNPSTSDQLFAQLTKLPETPLSFEVAEQRLNLQNGRRISVQIPQPQPEKAPGCCVML